MNFHVYKEAVYHRCYGNNYVCVYLEDYTCYWCRIRGPSILIDALNYKKFNSYKDKGFIKFLTPKKGMNFIKKTGLKGPLNEIWKDFVLNSINFYVED